MSGIPPTPTPVTPPPPPPPFAAVSNGIKLIGEVLLPGASLLAEAQIAKGALFTALGVVGGYAGGSLLGPLGYFLLRYGASAMSYYESIPPTTTPSNGNVNVLTQAVNNSTAYVHDVAERLALQHQQALQNLASQQQDALARIEGGLANLRRRVDAIVPSPTDEC
jgi:hypothetical protein